MFSMALKQMAAGNSSENWDNKQTGSIKVVEILYLYDVALRLNVTLWVQLRLENFSCKLGC